MQYIKLLFKEKIMIFVRKNLTKIFIVYVVKIENGYKMMYLIKNSIFNDDYKGMIVIINDYRNINFITKDNLIGKWIYAKLDSYGNILRLFD